VSDDRGFVDPANACFVAVALQMSSVECFDVVDTCNSWSRGLRSSRTSAGEGVYRRLLLVAAEFPLFDSGAVYPELFTLHRSEGLKHTGLPRS
jgi:3-oxoacyl-[acyl-carrier-protein] synthase III